MNERNEGRRKKTPAKASLENKREKRILEEIGRDIPSSSPHESIALSMDRRLLAGD